MQIINKCNQVLDRTTNLPIAHTTLINILLDLDLDIKVLYDSHENLMVENDLFAIDSMAVDLVIVSISDHPFDQVTKKEWWDQFDKIETPVIVLNSCITGNTAEIYCPVYAMIYSFPREYIEILSESQALESNRNYKISCLNNKPKIERLLNLLEITRRYNNQALISLLGNDEYLDHAMTEIKKILSPMDCSFLIENIVDKIPISIVDDNFINDYHCQSSAYYDAYLNIVTEYDFYAKTAFVSEKTIKPLLSGQFFVLLSSPGSIKTLEFLGFDAYRDIINHSVYENQAVNINNFGRSVITELHNYLETIVNLDWKDVYEKTASRRLYNRNLIINNHITKNFVAQLKTKINSLINKK